MNKFNICVICQKSPSMSRFLSYSVCSMKSRCRIVWTNLYHALCKMAVHVNMIQNTARKLKSVWLSNAGSSSSGEKKRQYTTNQSWCLLLPANFQTFSEGEKSSCLLHEKYIRIDIAFTLILQRKRTGTITRKYVFAIVNFYHS